MAEGEEKLNICRFLPFSTIGEWEDRRWFAKLVNIKFLIVKLHQSGAYPYTIFFISIYNYTLYQFNGHVMITSFFKQVRKLFNYLLGKSSELSELNVKDVLLAKVIFDIHRKRTHTSFHPVPLKSLQPIHAIDRETSIQSARQRTEALLKIQNLIYQKGCITRDILAEHLPSVSWIKVVKENETSYIAYEGNGRILAMKNAFTPAGNLQVEVEEYHFKNPKKILRRMNRVRKLNGLLKS